MASYVDHIRGIRDYCADAVNQAEDKLRNPGAAKDIVTLYSSVNIQLRGALLVIEKDCNNWLQAAAGNSPILPGDEIMNWDSIIAREA